MDYLINIFIKSGSEIGITKHPYFLTIEDEIESCFINKQINSEKVKDEIQYFKKNKLILDILLQTIAS